MTDQSEESDHAHTYLFDPPIKGKPPRSEQIDEVLSTVRAGKLGGRALLWLAGMIAAGSAIWNTVGGFWK